MSISNQENGNHSRIFKQRNCNTRHSLQSYWKAWRDKGKILTVGGKQEIGKVEGREKACLLQNLVETLAAAAAS